MTQKTFLTASILTLLASSASAYNLPVGPAISKAINTEGRIISVAVAEKIDIAQKAHDFVEELAERGIGFLSDAGLSEEARKTEFRDLLQDNFDMKTIGRFALGSYWKTSTEKERAEYLKLFEEMIIEVYSRRFGDYNGQKLNVKEARMESDTDAIVATSIIPASGPEIKVDWRVRSKSGKMQVVDVIVEGVSMSMTQRADFASVIQRGGGQVEVLLAHLRTQK